MKKLAIALLLLPSFCYSQNDSLPKNEKGIIEYTDVVNVSDADAQALYSRAKLFIAKAFVSGKAVTQLNDDDAKQIVANGNFVPVIKLMMGGAGDYGRVHFSITLQCKDGKYRYSITGFDHELIMPKQNCSGGKLENIKPACGTFYMTKAYWARVKESTDKNMKTLIAEMKNYMTANKTLTSDNW